MQIESLIKDINDVVRKKDGWFTEELSKDYSDELSKRLAYHFNDKRDRPTLRMSGLGPKCPRALWYSIHHPEMAEPLPPGAEIKFAFGHMIEALIIVLAKAAGHEVLGEQDALELDGIVGHRDCVIDGCIVDVKSASSISFQKFRRADYPMVDSFGYLDQLDAYVVASNDDPIVRSKDHGYILAVDKQLGSLILYKHLVRPQAIRDRIAKYKEIVALPSPPPCECKVETEGKSGNIRLSGPNATYNAFKYCCHPGLRKFLYKDGASFKPVYLTKVVRKPDVAEVDQYGRVVFN